MIQAIKIRLYPNKIQEDYISKLLGSSRFVYNQCLSYKIQEYNKNKKSVGFSEIGKYLIKLKDENNWLRESHSKVLQQSLINLVQAYKSFFKNGNGFPKFKSKKNYKSSCRFPSDAISDIEGNRISIIKQLKSIHFKCSKKDEIYLNKNKKMIKSGTLTKTKSGNYYFSILIDREIDRELEKSVKVEGIDFGVKDFIICSDGSKFENIKIRNNNESKIKKLNQKLSRKIGQKNREKCRVKLAKFHQKLNNKKEYYLHQVVNKLLNENQVIIIEDLDVTGMLKNRCLSKSIQELSLNKFKTILNYKAQWYNRDIIQIDRFFPSSKLCSNCGFKNSFLELKDREWNCPSCNENHERDFNASKNIKKEGLRLLNVGLNSPELKPLEIGQ